MQGIVNQTNAQRRMGFIATPGRPRGIAFFFDDLPAGLQLRPGDSVEFEEGQDRTNRPKAINIRFVAHGNAPAGNRQPQATQTQTVGVSWKFGEPKIVQDSRQIPVWVTFKRGDKPASGIDVTLYVNGTQQVFPAAISTTTGDGIAYFTIGLTLDVPDCDVLAVADGKNYATYYELPEPQLAAKELPISQQWMTLDITYGAGKVLVPTTLEVWPTGGSQLAIREVDQTVWQTQPGKHDVPTNGRSVIQVRIEMLAPGAGGENFFVSVQGTTISSGLFYISGNL